MNPSDVWRPFARLNAGYPEGDPLTIAEKLQLSMRVHLPRETSPDVVHFMERVRGHFQDIWEAELPDILNANASLTTNTEAEVVVHPADDGHQVLHAGAEDVKSQNQATPLGDGL